MNGKWDEKVGDTVYVFAGNFITGESKHVTVRNDSDQVEETVGELLRDFGFDHCVWATYNPMNTEESCILDFNNYMSFRYSKYMDECAA